MRTIPQPEDNFEAIIEEAHQIFGKTTVFEVFDMDMPTARATLLEFYESASDQDIERYLDILDRLRIAMADA